MDYIIHDFDMQFRLQAVIVWRQLYYHNGAIEVFDMIWLLRITITELLIIFLRLTKITFRINSTWPVSASRCRTIAMRLIWYLTLNQVGSKPVAATFSVSIRIAFTPGAPSLICHSHLHLPLRSLFPSLPLLAVYLSSKSYRKFVHFHPKN